MSDKTDNPYEIPVGGDYSCICGTKTKMDTTQKYFECSNPDCDVFGPIHRFDTRRDYLLWLIETAHGTPAGAYLELGKDIELLKSKPIPQRLKDHMELFEKWVAFLRKRS